MKFPINVNAKKTLAKRNSVKDKNVNNIINSINSSDPKETSGLLQVPNSLQIASAHQIICEPKNDNLLAPEINCIQMDGETESVRVGSVVVGEDSMDDINRAFCGKTAEGHGGRSCVYSRDDDDSGFNSSASDSKEDIADDDDDDDDEGCIDSKRNKNDSLDGYVPDEDSLCPVVIQSGSNSSHEISFSIDRLDSSHILLPQCQSLRKQDRVPASKLRKDSGSSSNSDCGNDGCENLSRFESAKVTRRRHEGKHKSSSGSNPTVCSRLQDRSSQDLNNNEADTKGLQPYLKHSPVSLQTCFRNKGFLTFMACIFYALFLAVAFTMIGVMVTSLKSLTGMGDLKDLQDHIGQSKRRRPVVTRS